MSLPGYSFDCFIKVSGITPDTYQDEQMLKDFLDAIIRKRCGVLCNRIVNYIHMILTSS